MITATIQSWYPHYSVMLDMEPWMEWLVQGHGNPASLETIRTMLKAQGRTLEVGAEECMYWTYGNYPTPELRKFLNTGRHHSMDRLKVEKNVIKRWLAQHDLKKLSTTAVDKLIGGEP